MELSNERLKAHLDERLDRIEQTLRGIYQILEANTDTAQDAHDIRERLKKSQEIIRQLNYEKWFNENKDNVSTTMNVKEEKK